MDGAGLESEAQQRNLLLNHVSTLHFLMDFKGKSSLGEGLGTA